MKRFGFLLLTVILVLCFTACGMIDNVLPDDTDSSGEQNKDQGQNNDHVHDYVAAINVSPDESEDIITYICGCGNSYTENKDKLVSIGFRFSLNREKTGYILRGVSQYEYGDVAIPDTFNGLPVVEIADNSFTQCEHLTSIVIPKSVKRIGYYSFGRCENLERVVVQSEEVEVGRSAFTLSKKLRSVVFEGKVTSLGDGAFSGDWALESVSIAEGPLAIGRFVFTGCKNLTDLDLPSEVASVGTQAFTNCDKLECTVFEGARYIGCKGNPYLMLLGVNDKDVVKAEIHPDTKFILDFAFSICNKLDSVIIPDRVEYIGEYAFESCNHLVSVTVGKSVKTIGYRAFANCRKLVEVINRSELSIGIGYDDNGNITYSALTVHKGESKIDRVRITCIT